MRQLKDILEGIFDTDEDTIDKNIKDQIKQFLKDNFKSTSSCKISDKPNSNGKYEVSSSRDIEVKNKKITSLTNDMFVWATVGRDFNCSWCKSLTSLEGAPKEVGGLFDCGSCNSLTSLEGAPKRVGEDFSCWSCELLTSLKGSPEYVGRNFYCINCHINFTIDDVKKVSDVKGKIYV